MTKKRFLRMWLGLILTVALVVGMTPANMKTVWADPTEGVGEAGSGEAGSGEAGSGEQNGSDEQNDSGEQNGSDEQNDSEEQNGSDEQAGSDEQQDNNDESQDAENTTNPQNENETNNEDQGSASEDAENNETAAAVIVLANNGYPYGDYMTSESVTLKIKIETGSGLSYQWQKSSAASETEPDLSAFSDIEGATGVTFSGIRVSDDGFWFRCVVSTSEENVEAVTSKAVQIIKPSNSADTFGRIWTYGDSDLYVSNGFMAYMRNGASFNVVGKYVKGSNQYMLQTSFSGSWEMFSSTNAEPQAGYGGSATLDDVLFAFGDGTSQELTITADLAEEHRSFAYGCDTQLGNYDTSSDYCDRAALIAKTNTDNTLRYIAMIGAASEESAVESDPAFLIKPETGTNPLFYIGRYSSREAYAFCQEAYDDYSDGGRITLGPVSATGSTVTSAAIKVEDVDSGMTMSWLDLESGAQVSFVFSVGSAAATGVEVASSTETQTAPSSAPSYSGGFSGGQSTVQSTVQEAYTIPVESNDSIEVGANISNGTARVDEITETDIEKVTAVASNTGGQAKANEDSESKSIIIDLSGAKQAVSRVELSKTTVNRLTEAAASKDNNVDTVKIKLTNATVEFDSTALQAISDQAGDNNIRLVVESLKDNALNDLQKAAVENKDVVETFEAYVESNGSRIHSFNGGTATVSKEVTTGNDRNAKHFHVVYLDPAGNAERMPSYVANNKVHGVLPHFSEYAVIYDETVENETGVAGIDPTAANTNVKFAIKAAQSGKALKVTWDEVSGADRYEIFAAYCGDKVGKKAVATVKKEGVTTATVKKLGGEALDFTKTFKLYAVAYKTVDGKKQKLGKSYVIHVAGNDNTATNVKSIKVEKTKISLAKGKKYTLKPETTLEDASKSALSETHTAFLRFLSTDESIAKVNKNGKITAKKAGTCYVWIYAQNGVVKKVKVTVK